MPELVLQIMEEYTGKYTYFGNTFTSVKLTKLLVKLPS